MSYFFLNFRHLIGDLAEEGQRVEARGDESPSAYGGECIRKWSRQPFEGALKFECLTYQANPRETHDMSPRLRGALASIIADPDCCAASKAIAREALRRSVDGRGSSQ